MIHVLSMRTAHLRRILFAVGVPALILSTAQAQSPKTPVAPPAFIVVDGTTRIADPKLDGGAIELSFHVTPVGTSLTVSVEVLQAGGVIATPFSGTLTGGDAPIEVTWDGRDSGGLRCDTGSYTVRFSSPGSMTVDRPLDIVRLGITEIEAQDSPAGDDEWQMVYFMKASAYAHYATPAIHEYVNTGHAFSISDIDQDNGDPRPVVPIHTDTDSPVLSGTAYETLAYNYPVAYVRSSNPRFELTFGERGTSDYGGSMPAGYPVHGREIRVVATHGITSFYSGPIVPGGTALIDLPRVSLYVKRVDTRVTYSWQQRAIGASDWADIPGSIPIPLRIYTLLSQPKFKAGASGTQYSGPWVEVAEYVCSWAETLGITANNEFTLTEAFVKGFFGQNGGIPTAIEGVRYDAYPLGGDGGATHYYHFGGGYMRLSRLLNFHASGVFVNCSDNMGAATTMLAMMGVSGMRPVRLGNMSLRAIWGIGAPAYTTALWGSGHSFSYHHIITNDNAYTVSDTCMQLDEDGNPDSTPGIPGWNHHRLWDGPGGYNDLSSNNNTSTSLESLPGIQ